MALISCPECGKEISDSAPSCPHCGFVLAKNLPAIRVSQLSSYVETSSSMGILYIVIGIIAIILGIFTMGAIVGVFVIIGGVAFIMVGRTKFTGTQEGPCPYCKHKVQVPVNATTYKCVHCGKTSTKKGNSLETI